MLKFLAIAMLIEIITTFSRFYGKFHLGVRDTEVSQLPFQYIMSSLNIKQSRTLIPNITLNFTNITLIINRYIDAGASGEVFLMQDI